VAQGNSPGPGVDAQGRPVVDPTQNVLDLVEAAIRRQDDLREMESRHSRELAKVRHKYEGELRAAEATRIDARRVSESKRIDAIRAVDVAAVNRAAEVSATQATTLAGQVAAAAEAARVAVQTAQSAATTELKATVEPLIQAVADLRRVQYEQQGGKAQVGEARLNMGQILGIAGLLVAIMAIVVAVTIGTR
jgi:hypothetical protein